MILNEHLSSRLDTFAQRSEVVGLPQHCYMELALFIGRLETPTVPVMLLLHPSFLLKGPMEVEDAAGESHEDSH